MATNKTAPLLSAEVTLRDKRLKLLLSYYKAATKKIISELESATDFGRSRRLAVLRNIDEILKTLDKNTYKWFQKEVTHYYETYGADAAAMLDKDGFPIVTGFTQIDKKAVTSLAEEIMSYYRDAYTGVKKSAMRMLNESARAQITALLAEGRISGDTRKQIADSIAGKLKEGLVALIDRSGRRWSLESYANMLTRTMLVRTANEGMTNRLRANGYDLVQVSDHAAECDLCHPWEGRVLSMSGANPNYQTVDDATRGGLFHPNCRHRLLPYHEKLLEVSYVWNPDKQRYIEL